MTIENWSTTNNVRNIKNLMRSRLKYSTALLYRLVMLKISYVAQNNWPLATRPQLSQNIQNLSLFIYLIYF